MAILNAGNIATKQPSAFFDVALGIFFCSRKAFNLSAITIYRAPIGNDRLSNWTVHRSPSDNTAIPVEEDFKANDH